MSDAGSGGFCLYCLWGGEIREVKYSALSVKTAPWSHPSLGCGAALKKNRLLSKAVSRPFSCQAPSPRVPTSCLSALELAFIHSNPASFTLTLREIASPVLVFTPLSCPDCRNYLALLKPSIRIPHQTPTLVNGSILSRPLFFVVVVVGDRLQFGFGFAAFCSSARPTKVVVEGVSRDCAESVTSKDGKAEPFSRSTCMSGAMIRE